MQIVFFIFLFIKINVETEISVECRSYKYILYKFGVFSYKGGVHNIEERPFIDIVSVDIGINTKW